MNSLNRSVDLIMHDTNAYLDVTDRMGIHGCITSRINMIPLIINRKEPVNETISLQITIPVCDVTLDSRIRLLTTSVTSSLGRVWFVVAGATRYDFESNRIYYTLRYSLSEVLDNSIVPSLSTVIFVSPANASEYMASNNVKQIEYIPVYMQISPFESFLERSEYVLRCESKRCNCVITSYNSVTCPQGVIIELIKIDPAYTFYVTENVTSKVFIFVHKEEGFHAPITHHTPFGELIVNPADPTVLPICNQDLTKVYPYIINCKNVAKITIIPKVAFKGVLVNSNTVKFEYLGRIEPISTFPLSSLRVGIGNLTRVKSVKTVCIFDGATNVGISALTGWFWGSSGEWHFYLNRLTIANPVEVNTHITIPSSYVNDELIQEYGLHVKKGEPLISSARDLTVITNSGFSTTLNKFFNDHYVLKINQGNTGVVGFRTIQMYAFGGAGHLEIDFIPTYSTYSKINIIITKDYNVLYTPAVVVKSIELDAKFRESTLPSSVLIDGEPTHDFLLTNYMHYKIKIALHDIPSDNYYIVVTGSPYNEVVQFRVNSIYLTQIYELDATKLLSGNENVLHFTSPDSLGSVLMHHIDFTQTLWTLEIILESFCENCVILSSNSGFIIKYEVITGIKFITVISNGKVIRNIANFEKGIDYIAISSNRGDIYINNIISGVMLINSKDELIYLGKGNFVGWFKGLKFTKKLTYSLSDLLDKELNQITLGRVSNVLQYNNPYVDLVVSYDIQ